MSQEYTEDKYIKFKKLSSGRRLLEVILLAICLSAVFLMVALLSFSPSDPSWSQTTWNAPVKNLGGSVGSWSADILFSAFGILAFAIPPLLLLGCWAIYHYESQRRYIDFFSLSLRLIGGLALILSSCGLAALNFDDLPNFASGGVIGSVFSSAIMPWFNSLGATLALLFLWAISFTLFTGWSWLTIAEKIGAAILLPITLLTNRARGDDIDDYDVEETEDALQRAQEAEHLANDNEQLLDADDVLFSAPTVAELAIENAPQAEVIEEQRHVEAPVAMPEVASATELDTLPSFTAADEPNTYHFEVPDDYQPQLGGGFEKQAEPTFEPAVSSPNYVPVTPPAFSPVNDVQPQHQGNQAFVEVVNTPSTPVIPEPQNTFIPQSSSELFTPAPTIGDVAVSSSVSERVADTAALAAAGISIAALERHAQVKQNMEPELPRPNPVRLPTRRELYGIRIPSQRDAELQRRQEEASKREEIYQQWSTNDVEDEQNSDDAQQAELLRAQFLEQQRERYGEVDNSDYEPPVTQVAPIDLPKPLQNEQGEQTPISSWTQPTIEHRWPSSSDLSANTHKFAEPEIPSIVPSDTFESHLDDEEDGFEPKIDLRKEFSVLDSFSPVDDLVDEKPADPLFMPTFTAVEPPVVPQNNSYSGLGNSQPATHTF
ncbi:DNA translocase FtsK 4TM domain-containing protein, partial [Providencia rettgeri]|nr:DNA translocase FtsK 4TM domain-containing protein [Providencia rettgeri]